MENAIGHKRGGEDVYGVVDMSYEHTGAEKY